MGMWIGRNRKARVTYGFDEIALVPGDVTITKGESLTFTNKDEFIHQIFVVGLFDSEEKNPGENLTESFPQSGTFEVHCHIHPKMRLVVHVR